MEVSPSFWEKEVFYQKTDLIVIGAGIVGLSAAIQFKLSNPKSSIRVIDESIFPKGASSRNAGFACFGSITELLADINQNGEEACLKLVEKRWNGLNNLRRLVGEKAMDYLELGGHEIFLDDNKESYEKSLNQLDRMNSLLSKVINESKVFSVGYNQFGMRSIVGLISNRLEGQLHPGKMMNALLNRAVENGIIINRGVSVKNIESGNDEITCYLANKGSLKANQVLIATNGFANRLTSGLDLMPARNQVLLTKPIPNLKIKGTFHFDEGYVYFRNIGQRILLGGGRQWDKKTAETSVYGTNQLIKTKLKKFMKDYLVPDFPTVEIEQEWSGILGVGKTKNPIVKFVRPKLAVAVRMGGMGVAIGASVGQEAADLLSNN